MRCLLPVFFLRVRVLPCWVGFLGVSVGWVVGWVFLPFAFLARVVSVARPRLRGFLNGGRGIVNALVLQSFVTTVPLPDVSQSLIQELLESLMHAHSRVQGFATVLVTFIGMASQ